MATIGELALVGGETILPHLHSLIPLLLDILSQGSTLRKEVAIQALGQLSGATGKEPFSSKCLTISLSPVMKFFLALRLCY